MESPEAAKGPGKGRDDLDRVAPAIREYGLEGLQGLFELSRNDALEEAEGVFLAIARDRRLDLVPSELGAAGEEDREARAGGVEGAGLVLDELEEGFDAFLVDPQAQLAHFIAYPAGLIVLEHLEEAPPTLLAYRVLEGLLDVEELRDEEEHGVGGGRGEVGRN